MMSEITGVVIIFSLCASLMLLYLTSRDVNKRLDRHQSEILSIYGYLQKIFVEIRDIHEADIKMIQRTILDLKQQMDEKK